MKFMYSQLSSESILEIVNSRYDLGEPLTSKFYVHGLHDNYLIEGEKAKYMFRVYRNNWRSEEAILFEVELLAFLKNTSSSVAAPVRTSNGELVVYIDAPEGTKIGVLFHYAEGVPPASDITDEECNLLGASVAGIHENTDNYQSNYKRPILDLPYLVDHSLQLIKPFLNAEQIAYLSTIRVLIYRNISHLTLENADFGICTGDINKTNFHISQDNIITHFDFDQCGYGFRAFEIGKFTVGFRNNNLTRENVHAFIEGYESVRKISEQEKQAIPYFEIAALIWVMSIHASNVDKIGYQYLDEDFWKKRIGLIERFDVD